VEKKHAKSSVKNKKKNGMSGRGQPGSCETTEGIGREGGGGRKPEGVSVKKRAWGRAEGKKGPSKNKKPKKKTS